MALSPPELAFQVETELMKNIINAVKKGTETTNSAVWKAERLKDMGKLNNANIKLIKKYQKAMLTGSAEEITAARDDVIYRYDTIYKKAMEQGIDIAPPQSKISEATRKLTEGFISQGENDMNYTLQSLLKGAKRQYQDILTTSSYKYIHGITTLTEAVEDTCKQWITKGQLDIVDAGGRNWSAESYSRMVLRTNQRQVTTAVSFQRNSEYGNSLIEVSSHADARKLCAPYQGHIYDTKGKSKKYPSLSSTSYGEPAGLFMINCRHDAYPYIPGVSSKTFDPSPFDEEAYNISQEQRRGEVAIRNAKRNLELTKANGGNVAKATAKVKAAQANQRAFINETGRTRRYNREQLTT